ncbi:MAG: DUF1059 domain-containing protein [Patescibacteria group bacterium]|nr:DUF1059 domain-containing protein [Patescibacteria group bacterium]
MEQRKVSDCRKMPSEKNCSVVISGTEAEVMPLVMHHVINDHGHTDTPELREEIKNSLTNE